MITTLILDAHDIKTGRHGENILITGTVGAPVRVILTDAAAAELVRDLTELASQEAAATKQQERPTSGWIGDKTVSTGK